MQYYCCCVGRMERKPRTFKGFSSHCLQLEGNVVYFNYMKRLYIIDLRTYVLVWDRVRLCFSKGR